MLSMCCVQTQWKCDGHRDCEDGSDEAGCGPAVPSCLQGEELQCGPGGKCVSLRWRCDGEWDCEGGQDEEGCKQQVGKTNIAAV